MSQENVETVRKAHDAFMRRDNQAAMAFYDPQVEIFGEMDGRIYRGLDGVRDFFRDWLGVWDEYGSEVEEWIDAGDHAIAVVHSWGRGKQSGAAVERREAHVWTLRDGKLWRLRLYPTKGEALEAVGLRE
jgi:uncharacterized protein